MSDEEEEWPSVGLNLEAKEEPEDLGEESVVEEIEVSDEEEEWPSVGLNLEVKEEPEVWERKVWLRRSRE